MIKINKIKTPITSRSTDLPGLFSLVKPWQRSQKLFYLAHAFQKEQSFDFCWTSRGVVYLRAHVNCLQIKIECEADLERLRYDKWRFIFSNNLLVITITFNTVFILFFSVLFSTCNVSLSLYLALHTFTHSFYTLSNSCICNIFSSFIST